jgi:lipopolysaccharide biosynthesis protein
MPEISPNKHLSLAVHLHIYYVDMWEEIKEYLKNIGDYPYDLFVTMVEDNQELRDKITTFHKASKIWVVENRGYDVGPFIHVLNQVDLNDYDYVIKIHSKGTSDKGCRLYINGVRLTQKLWHQFLLEGILRSPKFFQKIMSRFEENPKLGMVGAKKLITSDDKVSERLRSDVDKQMTELGFGKPKEIRFIAGTMFMCRAKLLNPIKSKFMLHDFAPTDGSVKDGTLAHVLERILGTSVIAQGYEIQGYDCNLYMILRGIGLSLIRFIYQSKVTKNNVQLIKIYKLPIYSKKIN